MNPILPTEETIEYEDRLYLNPQIGLDESNQFIENLRETQDNNIAQTQTQTQRLGTDVPSSLGGLTGPGSYFTSRYATPQNSSTLQNLRTAAQATALNQVLANEQAMWKKRYDDAYRAYQKRAWDKSNGGGGDDDDDGEDPDYNSTDKKVGSVEPQFSPAGSGTYTFTPKALDIPNLPFSGGGSIGINTNTIYPAGEVNIVRNQGGGIESLTYNGKTFTGDAAEKKFNILLENGTLSKAEE